MTAIPWLSLVALSGCLALAFGAFHSRRVAAGQAVTLGLAWLAIFLLVTAAFTYLRR